MPSDTAAFRQWTVVLVAAIFLAVHLAALPRTLEDIDSVNFALGVESFDVADHRPHPPGYPIFIALSKISTAAAGVLRPDWDRDRRAASGLAIWSVVTGALGVGVIAWFWIAAGLAPAAAVPAAVLAVVSPLYWLTASRPLTDTFGLVLAVGAQAWLLDGMNAMRAGAARLPRSWLLGASATGLLVGVRSQTMWLTGPFFCWAIWTLLRGQRTRQAAVLIALAAAGVLVWAIPMVADTGGVAGYVRAVQSQGAEDLSGVELLSTMPSVRLLAAAIRRSFVDPWQVQLFGYVVLALAAGGTVVLMRRRQSRLLAIVLLGFGPYLLFHLAFQETVTVRYALPLVVPMAGLAVIALSSLGSRVAAIGVVSMVVMSLTLVQPELRAYAASGAPVHRAFQDMEAASAEMGDEVPLLRMHHQVWWGVRRVLDWYRPEWAAGPQPFPGDREWLAIAAHWRDGGTRPIWLLADLKRADIAAIDPRARVLAGHYERPAGGRVLIGGTRLDGLNWWTIEQPGWTLGTGWSLTPELAGVTVTDNVGPARRPAEAFLRRRGAPVRLLVGGRYIGGEAPAAITVAIDDVAIADWSVSGDQAWFVRWVDVPAGVPDGPGRYATLTVAVSSAAAGAPVPEVALEQFDAAVATDTIFALETGWHELEHDPATGRLWRWMSERGVIEVRGDGPGDLTLLIEGDSPLRDFDEAPTVVIRAGAQEVGRFRPSSAFAETVALPRAAVAAASGRIAIETDRTFSPYERGDSPDRRRLGLRLSRVEVR